jgi:hypothetical protein
MNLEQIEHGLLTLARSFYHDPVRLITVLAGASAVTLVIALINDSLAVRRKPVSRTPDPRSRG